VDEPAKSAPGPMGEYFAIDDVDAADKFYGMVDLDAPGFWPRMAGRHRRVTLTSISKWCRRSR
jgi:hypothetical protein